MWRTFAKKFTAPLVGNNGKGRAKRLCQKHRISMRQRFSRFSRRKKLEEGKGRNHRWRGHRTVAKWLARETIGMNVFRSATTTFCTVLGTRMAKIHRGLLCSPRFISARRPRLRRQMEDFEITIIVIRGGKKVKKVTRRRDDVWIEILTFSVRL